MIDLSPIPSILKEKRKWQIALRRYVLQGHGSYIYAPYFGIDAPNFRKWIEIQLKESITWNDFPSKWQFETYIPIAYFDLNNQEDLKLCWNFTNIRIDKGDFDSKTNIITTKSYFENLYSKTHYSISRKMVDKIKEWENSLIKKNKPIEEFINQNKEYLEIIKDFSIEDYNQLNSGVKYEDILIEHSFIKKFG